MRYPNTVRSSGKHTLMSVSSSLTTLTWRLTGPKFDTDFPEVQVRDISDAAEVVHDLIGQLAIAVDPKSGHAKSRIAAIVDKLREAGRDLSTALFQGHLEKVRSLALRGELDYFVFTVPEAGFNFPLEFAVFKDDDGSEFFLGDRILVVRKPAVSPQFITYEESDKIMEEVLPKWSDEPTAGYAEDHTLDSACKDAGTPCRPDEEEVYALAEIISLDRINHLAPITVPAEKNQTFEDWLLVSAQN